MSTLRSSHISYWKETVSLSSICKRPLRSSQLLLISLKKKHKTAGFSCSCGPRNRLRMRCPKKQPVPANLLSTIAGCAALVSTGTRFRLESSGLKTSRRWQPMALCMSFLRKKFLFSRSNKTSCRSSCAGCKICHGFQSYVSCSLHAKKRCPFRKPKSSTFRSCRWCNSTPIQ